MMHRYFCVVVGRWKFTNWHLYRDRDHQSRDGKSRWRMWDKII